mgnify:FL=1
MKRKLVAGALVASMAIGIGAGCNKNKPDNDNNTTGGYQPTEQEQTLPLVFGIDGADGVFNPYFSTASYDGEIVGMTQIGMLTAEGTDYKYGDNYACVTKDLDITYIDASGKETTRETSAQYTRYDFLIKKGIKFSDGVDLTIKDVLFNLYLFLDPAYSGSSTIYSTDIVGLNKYRTGKDDKGAMSTIDATATTNADMRLLRIYNWLNNQILIKEYGTVGSIPANAGYVSGLDQYKEEIEKDIKAFIPYFQTEVRNDYDSAESSFKETCKEYAFNEVWELYLYNYGKVKRKTHAGTSRYVKVDDAGNEVSIEQEDANDALADNDPNKKTYRYKLDWDGTTYHDDFAKLTTDEAKKDYAIKYIYKTTTGFELTEDFTIDYDKIEKDALRKAIYGGSASYSSLYTDIQLDERSKIIAAAEGDNTGFKSIEGIKYSTQNSFRNEKTKEYYDLDGDYDVLSITINKVDPKAIWNFSFTVAPMHYYSYDGAGDEGEWCVNNNYGVVFNSSSFMNDTVKAPSKLGVPVGAGPYKASRETGLGNDLYPGKNEFLNNNRVYYERNTYFDTLDGVENGGPIQNAKVKYFQYKIVNSSVLLQSLEKNEIDVGTPNATTENLNALNGATMSHLTSKMVWTNGYGYVGINAGKIADVWLRRAIIKAMNTDMIMGYYKSDDLASIIYRPMSIQSWAYPDSATTYSGTTLDNYDVDYIYDGTGREIVSMLAEHGYNVSADGSKVISDLNGKAIEEMTFTIAGESDDHPAYQMFKNAQEVLKKIGINVNVKTDQFALKKLASGQLTVWAAAWGSTIDPDMYQVYHKDSTAGSTLNWGYREIKADRTKYSYENQVIDELSTLIDQGRATTNQNTRKTTYWEALDLVMELAVEMPTYQRRDLTVYNKNKIDTNTLNQNPTAFDGLFSKIWEVGYTR